MKKFLRLLSIMIVFLILSQAVLVAAQEDVFPTNGWQTSTPEEQGMDSVALAEFLDYLTALNFDSPDTIHSMLLIRHGRIVIDYSAYPFNTDQLHWQFSITNSVISTLVGIAIDQGYFEGVDQSIWDFFSAEATANMDNMKAAITIEDLLTERSGLAITDDFPMYSLTAEDQSWVQFVLDTPMREAPGTTFDRHDANVHLLSALLQQATGRSTLEFAQENLFSPLGITDVRWQQDPQGVNWGGDGLMMSPHSMAKLGYLYLRHGMWDGQQIVSSDWVDTATSPIAQTGRNFDYGYEFRSITIQNGDESHHAFWAHGYGVQTIWVVPDLDLILIATGDSGINVTEPLLGLYIFPAITSDTALPPNPDGLAQMQALLDTMAHPVPRALAVADIVQDISGQVFTFEDNELGWQSLTLDFSEGEALLSLEVNDSPVELPIGLDGIYRVSEGTEALWLGVVIYPHPSGVPLAARGFWTLRGDHFNITVWSLAGDQSWTLNLAFGDTLTVEIAPVLLSSSSVRFESTPQ